MQHRHFYLKTGLMGGWHDVNAKHPLDPTAHDHGDIEVREDPKAPLSNSTIEPERYFVEFKPPVETATMKDWVALDKRLVA